MIPLQVLTAAVLDGEKNIHTLERPARHDDVMDVVRTKGAPRPYTKGFLLSDGTFADRAKAEDVARANGQKTGNLKHPHLGGLSSDDLW